MKRQVYFCQINHLYGQSCFLPYSTGMLQAAAQADADVRCDYEFKETFFLRESPHALVARMDRPAVFAASMYVWNGVITLAVCRAVKAAFPHCLVVLGGPHVPERSEGYFYKHPYVDVLVHGEGEETFPALLKQQACDQGGLLQTPGLSVNANLITIKTGCPKRVTDLGKLPSPYLTGVFDQIMKERRWEYQATSETHRGCGFSCVFSATGAPLSFRRYAASLWSG